MTTVVKNRVAEKKRKLLDQLQVSLFFFFFPSYKYMDVRQISRRS